MKTVAVSLAFAIVAPALPAHAAPPRASEESYRELEAASGLDLAKEWAAYRRDGSGPFDAYVDQRFRLRRDIGRGFVVAAGVLFITASLCFAFAFTAAPGDYQRTNYGIAGASTVLGGGLAIAGAALWGVYGPRVERLEVGTDKLEFAKRGGPRLTFGGTGLRLAF